MIMIIWNEEEKQYENNERMFFRSLFLFPIHSVLCFNVLYVCFFVVVNAIYMILISFSNA